MNISSLYSEQILVAQLAAEGFLYRWNRVIHNSRSFHLLPHRFYMRAKYLTIMVAVNLAAQSVIPYIHANLLIAGIKH